MFSSVILLLPLLPLQAQCAPASPNRVGIDLLSRRDHDVASQAPLAATNASLSFSDTDGSPTSASPNPIPHSLTGSAAQSSSPDTASARPLVMAYYPDWAAEQFPPKNINFTMFDWIDFAFAIPDENYDIKWDSDDAPELLRALVSFGHSSDSKIKLSIGGWTGSRYFSSAVATYTSRYKFASNIRDVYQKFQLDGIDIDWEYPGQEGDGGNQVSPHDSVNFLSFLQLLRGMLPGDARITAAAQDTPFADDSGRSWKDVSAFAEVLDWILVMNYDVWGSSTTPGPNAPFFNNCENSTQPEANALASYEAWTSAGFPANKLVLGLPSYGYVSTSSASGLRQRSIPNNHHSHPKRDGGRKASDSVIKIKSEDGDGQILFRQLLSQGALALVQPGDGENLPVFEGAGGFERHWDSCSSTPFLSSASAGQIITYDDPKSLSLKAEFVRKVGMLGVNMFDIHGDTDEWYLTDAVRKTLFGPV